MDVFVWRRRCGDVGDLGDVKAHAVEFRHEQVAYVQTQATPCGVAELQHTLGAIRAYRTPDHTPTNQ